MNAKCTVRSMAISIVALSALLCGHPPLSASPISFTQQKSKSPQNQQSELKVKLSDLPHLRFYRVDPYINAIHTLQKMGKDRAIENLRQLAKEEDEKDFPERVILLCRMLFMAKPGKEFRRAYNGGSVPIAGDVSDWLRLPIEIVDGVPFYISYGGGIGGAPETCEQYLQYCLENCDWNATKFEPKTEKQKVQALDKLMVRLKELKAREGARAFLEKQLKQEDKAGLN